MLLRSGLAGANLDDELLEGAVFDGAKDDALVGAVGLRGVDGAGFADSFVVLVVGRGVEGGVPLAGLLAELVGGEGFAMLVAAAGGEGGAVLAHGVGGWGNLVGNVAHLFAFAASDGEGESSEQEGGGETGHRGPFEMHC